MVRLEIERPLDAGEQVNQVPNPSGELGAWGYITPTAGTVLRSVLTDGVYRLVLTSPGGAPSWVTTEPVPVVAGRHVSARWLAEAVTGRYSVQVEWLSLTGVLLSTTSESAAYAASATARVYGSVQAPAGAGYYRVRFNHYSNSLGANPVAGSTLQLREVTATAADAPSDLGWSRTNLMPTPSGEAGPGAWTALGGTVSTSTAQALVGTRSLIFTRNTGEGSLIGVGETMTVRGGRDYAVQARSRARGNLRKVTLEVRFRDTAGAIITTAAVDQATEREGQWNPVIGVVTAPTNAATANLRMNWGKVKGGEVHYADAVMVEQASTLGTYFDGSTTPADGVTYSWDGTPHQSPSVAAGPVGDIGELATVTYQNILGPTAELTVARADLNVGTLDATILSTDLDPARDRLIRPGRRVRLVTTDGAVLCAGKAFTASVKYELLADDATKRARITLSVVDGVNVLASVARSEGVATIDELPYVLEGVGLPWSVNGSGDQVPDAVVSANNDNAMALDQVVVTRDSARGYAWVDRNGVLQAWDVDQLDTTPAAVLDESVYTADIDVDYSIGDLINEVTVVVLRPIATTGVTEEVRYGPYRNEDSIAEWGVYSGEYTVQGAGFDDETTVAAYGQSILDTNSEPAVRLNTAVVPIRTAEDITTWALRDLYDVVTVINDRAGIDGPARITSLTHAITPEKWLLTLGFSEDGVAAPTLATPTPPAGVGTIKDDIETTIGVDLQELYDRADANAAAAAAAALSGQAAQQTADGKNTVTYSPNGPGNTPNKAGDIWWQRSDGVVVGQWQGLGGTAWESVVLAGLVIAYIDAAQITAGSAFVNGLYVKTNFTLGDAETNGVIQSHNFAGSDVGVYIDKYGLVAKGGTIAGALITGSRIEGATIVGDLTMGGRFSARHALIGNAAGNNLGIESDGTISWRFQDTVQGSIGPGGVANLYSVAVGAGGLSVNGAAYATSYSTGGSVSASSVSGSTLFTTSQGGEGDGDAVIGPGGQVKRKTSSRHYKHDITPLAVDPATVLALEPKTFKLNEQPDGITYPGFIAEEAEELGLDWWVLRNADGDVDGFRYTDWTAALQLVCRAQQQQIDTLTQQVAALTARLDKHEAATVSTSINLKGR
jgi:hypothetical protein